MDEKRTTADVQAKPRRRWYQYSLRTLLIVVTIIGCGFGWLGAKVRIVRERKAMRSEIERRGALVINLDDTVWSPDTKPEPVGLIRRWMGDEALCEVYVSRKEMRSTFAVRIKELFPEAIVSESLVGGREPP